MTGSPGITLVATFLRATITRTRSSCRTRFVTAPAISNRSVTSPVFPGTSARRCVLAESCIGSVLSRALPETSTGRDGTTLRLPRFVTRTCTLRRARCRRRPDRDPAGCKTAERTRTRTSLAGFCGCVEARLLSVVAVVSEVDALGGSAGEPVELSSSPESWASPAPTATPPIAATTTAATSFPNPRRSMSDLMPNRGPNRSRGLGLGKRNCGRRPRRCVRKRKRCRTQPTPSVRAAGSALPCLSFSNMSISFVASIAQTERAARQLLLPSGSLHQFMPPAWVHALPIGRA